MPPPALVETPGAANANTYATLAEANVYISSRLNTTVWDDSTTDQKNAALLQAARLLDSVMCWTGSPTDEDVQALAWPRTGMYNRNGGAIASNVIPQQLKDAQSELARQLQITDLMATNDVSALGITEVKAGPVGVKFNTQSIINGAVASTQLLLPYAVVNLLVPSWICDDWVNAQTPPERYEYEFERFDTDTDVDVDE